MVFFPGLLREDGTEGEARFEVMAATGGPSVVPADPGEPGRPTATTAERMTLEAAAGREGADRSRRLCLGLG